MRTVQIAALALGAAVALPSVAVAADAVTLKFLTAWDNRYKPYEYVVTGFSKNVEAASGGTLKLSAAGPEVVKPNQQYQPTSRGVFDLNWSTPAYFIGTTSVPFPFYAMPPDPDRWHSSGVWDLADKDYQRNGQKLIAMLGGGSSCDQFHVMLKQPIDPATNFKGWKIRANAFYKDLVGPMGGSTVNLPAGEIYAALQKGVVDGAAWPVVGAVNFRWYEVSKYMMRPRFGCTITTMAMNLDRFNKLNAMQRDAIAGEGRKFEHSILPALSAQNEAEAAELKRLGVKETWADKKQFADLMRNRQKGLWDLAMVANKRSAAHVKEMREVARKAGLAD